MLAKGTAKPAGAWCIMSSRMTRSNIHPVSFHKLTAPKRIETAAS